MDQFADSVREAKKRMDQAMEAAARGDWLAAEHALRDAQLEARELRLFSLTRRLGDA